MRAAHPVAAPSLLVFALLGSHAAAQEARDWLDRMSRAVDELNYRGTFVHVLDGTAETLHIVHRSADGQSGERILSLDGAGREIVRQGARVQGIFPDRRIVLFETRSDVSPLVSALPSDAASLEPHYEMTLGGTRAWPIAPCKCSTSSRATSFVTATCFGSIKRRRCRCSRSSSTSRARSWSRSCSRRSRCPQTFRRPRSSRRSTPRDSRCCARPSRRRSPERFRGVPRPCPAVSGSRSATQSPIAGSDTPVEHLVYSDGLATVSVFIEDPATKAEVREGFSNVGSTNAYSTTLRGRKVTAIGEVPRKTVRTIASSLVAE